MSSTDYEFDWDDAKATTNLRKHEVDFRDAMTVLLDPMAMTFHDIDQSQDEERWVSVGRSSSDKLLVVIHTFVATGPNNALVRIISPRAATRQERQQYEQGTLQ